MLLQRTIQVVVGGNLSGVRCPGDEEEASEEWVGSRLRNHELEFLENGDLHVQDVLFRVRAVANVHAVLHFRWVDFFVFGGYEHSRHSDKLKLLASHSDSR